MLSNVLVYTSGPLTSAHGFTLEQNIAAAVAVYFRLIAKGIPAFCPQMGGAFPSAFNIHYDTWIEYDYRVIDRCTHLLMLDRWQTSKGARLEMAYASNHGISVVTSEQVLIEVLQLAGHEL